MAAEAGGSSEFERLVGKAVFDPGFARSLRDDPRGALESIGIEATDEVIDALAEVDLDAIEDLAAAMGDDRGIV